MQHTYAKYTGTHTHTHKLFRSCKQFSFLQSRKTIPTRTEGRALGSRRLNMATGRRESAGDNQVRPSSFYLTIGLAGIKRRRRENRNGRRSHQYLTLLAQDCKLDWGRGVCCPLQFCQLEAVRRRDQARSTHVV